MNAAEARAALTGIPFPACNDTQVQHNAARLREVLEHRSVKTLRDTDQVLSYVALEVFRLKNAIDAAMPEGRLKDSWNYEELPKGMYSAGVYPMGERFMFLAYPNQGDHCVEGVYDTREEACRIGARFAAGETNLPGLYTAAF